MVRTEEEFWAEVERIISLMDAGLMTHIDHECNPPFGMTFCEICAADQIRHAE